MKVYIVFICIILFISGMSISCNHPYTVSITEPAVQPVQEPEPEVPPLGPKIKRKWTIVIYMAADNDLESAAIRDIDEMERSNLNTDEVTVLMLIDRSTSYDVTNGNWSGGRVYKLRTGKETESISFISEQISCGELDLEPGTDKSVDMSSSDTLARMLRCAVRTCPAEKYGLIMWGHGNGWRSENTSSRSFAFDDQTDSYMTLVQLRKGLESGLNGMKLDFIGFDACLAGELEVMYELRNEALWSVCSEGLVQTSGWNYCAVLNDMENDRLKTAESFCTSVVGEFSLLYASQQRASISIVDMRNIANCFSAFNTVAQAAADCVTTAAKRNDLYTNITSTAELYSYSSSGCDKYCDIDSLIRTITVEYPAISDKAQNFYTALKKCVPVSWASDRMYASLGVYFCSMNGDGSINTVFPDGYITGKDKNNQIQFVSDGTGYVPSGKKAGSLLDKLFYSDLY